MTTAAAFWLRIEAAEKASREQIAAVRIRATGNHRVAQNDEPEPRTFRDIEEAAQAEARAILRGEAE